MAGKQEGGWRWHAPTYQDTTKVVYTSGLPYGGPERTGTTKVAPNRNQTATIPQPFPIDTRAQEEDTIDLQNRHHRATEGITEPMMIQTKARCVECGRVFDLLDEDDAGEFYYGHDCEED